MYRSKHEWTTSNAVSMADWLTRTVQAAGIERTLKAGQVLFRIGHRTAGFYEVVTGTIRLVRVDRAGREAVLHIAVAGETLAEASLFAPAYHCDAIATTKAVVLPAQAFMAMLAHQVMTLRTNLELRNIHSARDRIRHYLALNAGADGRTVVVRGTLKDLANELGLTHEALYRTLADMAAAGEIERRKGKIMLT
jgi:CRP-like cAMP-binding protein